MQTVNTFVFGRDRVGTVNQTPIEKQINDYLENHPGYSVSTMSVLNAVGYQEAFVVFNIREERKLEPKQDRLEKKAKPQ